MDYDIVDERSSFAPSPAVPLWKDIWNRAPFSLLFLLFSILAVFFSQVYLRWKEQRATKVAWLEQRRRAGIPDSDKRPWNTAYADAQRRIPTQKKQEHDMSASNSIQSLPRRSSFRSRRPSFASRRSSFNSGPNTPRPSTPRVPSQHFHFGSAFPEPARSPRYVSNISPLRFDSRPATPAHRESTPSIFGGESFKHPISANRFSTVRSPSLSRYDDRASDYGSNIGDTSFPSESIHIEPSTNSVFVPHSEFKPRQPTSDSEASRLAYLQRRGPAFAKRAAELLESQSEHSTLSSAKRQRIGQDSVIDQRERAPKRPATENDNVFESDSEHGSNMSYDVPLRAESKRSKFNHSNDVSQEDFVMVDSESIPTTTTKQDRRSSVIPGGLFDFNDCDIDMESEQKHINDTEGGSLKKRDIDQVDSSIPNSQSTASVYPPTKSSRKHPAKSPKLSSTTSFSEVQGAVNAAKSPFMKSSERVPTWIPWSPIKRKPGDRWENEDGDQFLIDEGGKERTLVQVKQWRPRKNRMPAKWSNEEEANIPEKTLVTTWLTQEEFEKAQKLNMLGGQPDVEAPPKSAVEDWNSTLEADTSSVYYRRGTGTPLGRRASSIGLATRKPTSSTSPKQKLSAGKSGIGASRLRDTTRTLVKPSKSMRSLPRPATAAERQEAELSNPKRHIPQKQIHPTIQTQSQTSTTTANAPSIFGATSAPSTAANSGTSTPNNSSNTANNNTANLFGATKSSSTPASIFGAPPATSASSTTAPAPATENTIVPSFLPTPATSVSSTLSNPAPSFSFGKPLTTTASSSQGSVAAAPSKPSLFGGTGSVVSPPTTSASGSSIFGSSISVAQTNTTPSLLGNTATSATNNPPSFAFGSTSNSNNNTVVSAATPTSNANNNSTTPSFAFGNNAPASNTNGFAKISPSPTVTTANSGSTPSFGIGTGGASAASPFGFGQKQQSVTSTPPLTKTSSAPASTFSFSNTSTSTATTNATDSSSTSGGAFSFGKDTTSKPAAGAFSFGQPTTSSAFGQSTTPSAFGQSASTPSFGQSATASAFGQPTASSGSGSNTPTLTISSPNSPGAGAPTFNLGNSGNKPLNTSTSKPRRPRSSRH